MKTIFATSLLCASALALSTAPAFAQQAPAEEQQAEDADAGAGDIVVSVRKRSENIRDVPVSILAVSGESLAKAGVANVQDMARFTPGVAFARAPDNGIALTIRGLGTPARNQAFEQAVGMFADEVFFGKGRMYGAALMDVESVEVVKGTQSTLLGKNTSLGGVSIKSRRPGRDLGANFTGGVDLTTGGWDISGGVDLPASDAIRFRVSGLLDDKRGQVKNRLTDRYVQQEKNRAIRFTGAFDLGESIKAIASYQFNRQLQIGNGYQTVYPGGVISGQPPFLTGSNGAEARLDKGNDASLPDTKSGDSEHFMKMHLARLGVDFELGDHTLSSITAFSKFNIDYKDDFDFLPGSFVRFDRVEDYKQFTQEVRLASPTGKRLEYLVGAFYLNSDWNSLETQRWAVPSFPPPGAVPIPPPLVPIAGLFPTFFSGGFVAPGQLFNGAYANDFSQKLKSLSAFASVNFKLADNLKLTGGLRYTDEKKDMIFGRSQVGPATFWNTFANRPFARTPVEYDDSFLNGNASIQYNVNDDVMFYASYGVGSKIGGLAEAASIANGDPRVGNFVVTETAKTWEAGTKISFADRAGLFSLAVFRTDVDDLQSTTFSGGAFVTSNVDVKSQGFDAALDWRISKNLSLRSGLVYADSKVKATGLRFTNAPDWSGNIAADLNFPISGNLVFNASANMTYRGKVFTQDGERFPTPTYTPIGLSFGIADADGKWDLRLVGRNINDDLSLDFGGDSPVQWITLAGGSVQAPMELRNISLRATIKF